MTDKTHDNVVARLENDLSELGTAVARIDEIEAEVTRRTKAIVAEYAAEMDGLTKTRDEKVASVTDTFTENRDTLTAGSGKTVTLRGGTLSARWAKPALVIDDVHGLEAWLRSIGEWSSHSDPQPRKLNRDTVKDDQKLIDRAPDGIVHIEKKENLIIKLPKSQVKIEQVLNPLTKRLNGSS